MNPCVVALSLAVERDINLLNGASVVADHTRATACVPIPRLRMRTALLFRTEHGRCKHTPTGRGAADGVR